VSASQKQKDEAAMTADDEMQEILQDTNQAVDDVNAVVDQWVQEGFRQEVMCGAFLGWLSAFAANGPTPERVLEALVTELRKMTAERMAARKKRS
jgi:hypothetical protein